MDEKDLKKREKEIDKKVEEVKKKEKEINKKVEEVKKLTKGQIIFQKAKKSVGKFKEELKKSTNIAIITAFSLLVALAWKDVLTGYVNKILEISPLQGKLISAIIITIIAVIVILSATKFLSIKEK